MRIIWTWEGYQARRIMTGKIGEVRIFDIKPAAQDDRGQVMRYVMSTRLPGIMPGHVTARRIDELQQLAKIYLQDWLKLAGLSTGSKQHA